MKLRCLLMCIALLAGKADARETFLGQVTHVTDGDTLWVQPDEGGPARKLRLRGLDAPEICQQGGMAAREFLVQLALRRRVTVNVVTDDPWGRGVATIALDGRDLGAEIVRAGLAWSYGWRGRAGVYAAQEALARGSGQGVFALPEPQSPRDFRKRHGSCRAVAP